MPGTVITDLQFFTGATGGSTSNCDAITDWVSAPTLDQITFVEGTGSCSAKVSKTTFTSVFSFASAVDLTDKVLYIWAMCSGKLDTLANGGLRIRVVDGAGNWGEWYVAGANTWAGGWQPFLVHTSTTFSASSATSPTISAITKAGIVFTTVGSATAINCWWDALRYGTYLGVKGGTDVSPATLQDMMDAEATYKYGVIFQYEGLSIVQGKLVFGSTTGGDATYFKDTSEKILIFADKPVPSTWYDIKLQGNATATTKVYFGLKVGGSGASGITARASSSGKPFTITASDTNITEYGFYGCTFYQASTITLQAYSLVKEFLDCIISKSAEMLPNTGIVKNCTFTGSAGKALRIASASHYVTDSKFVNCQTATHINLSATVVFNNLKFYGNTYDIEHSVVGALTINCENGSNPDPAKVNETGGGSTSIVNTVSLKVYVKDEANAPIQGASAAIYKTSDNTQLMNELADVNGLASESFNYPGSDVDIYIRVRKSTTGTRYIPLQTTGTITSGGFTLTAILIKDLVLV